MSSQRPRGRPPHPDLLTPAEWRVAEAVRHGMTNPEIASRQGVSTEAVKYHVANALQKLGLSSRHELRRWQGVRRDSKLFTMERQMSEHPVLGPVGQIARSVGDIAAARLWYGEVLGLPHLFSFGNLAFFDCDGIRLFVSAEEGQPHRASIIYFRVPDIDAAYRELQERGVPFEGAPHLIHRHASGVEEWMAFFRDPDDNMLALMAQVQPSG